MPAPNGISLKANVIFEATLQTFRFSLVYIYVVNVCWSEYPQTVIYILC